MAGTAASAALNVSSGIAASALIPARNSSLLRAVWPRSKDRCLSDSRTVYSPLGIVKLSRTNLGFFGLVGSAGTATFLGAGWGAGAARWVAGALRGGAFLTTAAGWATFLAAGAGAVLTVLDFMDFAL